METPSEEWIVITLHETCHASGKFLAELLVSIRSIEYFSYITIGNIEGINVSRIAEDRRYYNYTFDDIHPLISEVEQFYWCDLFCFDNKCEILNFDLWTIGYSDIISKTLISLRVIDYNDIEVFTRSTLLYDRLAKEHKNIQYYSGYLSEYLFRE
jgi:hypothetical protein